MSILAILTSGCLSYPEFLNSKNDKYCDMFQVCNPEGNCDLPDETGGGDTGCDFDAGAARHCLRDEWSCNTDVPGFEYPLPPLACETVCR